MGENMEVAFTIRRAELKRVFRELDVNRGSEGKDDLASIVVWGAAATFRAPGTGAECAVEVIEPGAVQLALELLDSISDLAETAKLELHFREGVVACGRVKVRRGSITLGTVPDSRIQVPIDLSNFELLVVEKILGKELAKGQGLQPRIEKAKKEMNGAVARASSALADFGVNEDGVRRLVEAAMEDAKDTIAKGLST
jgi:hypothetical protein